MEELDLSKPADKLKAWKRRIEEDFIIFEADSNPALRMQTEMLVSAIEREIFNLNNSIPKRVAHNKKVKEKNSFIKGFESRFTTSFGSLPETIVSPQQQKQLGVLLGKLEDMGVDQEMYLDYVFDQFLEDNEKFSPPTFGLLLSNMLFDSFRYKCNEEIANHRKKKRTFKEKSEVEKRWRVIYRKSNEDVQKQLLKWKEDFDAGRKTLKAFRDLVLQAEKIIIDKKKEKINGSKENG